MCPLLVIIMIHYYPGWYHDGRRISTMGGTNDHVAENGFVFLSSALRIIKLQPSPREPNNTLWKSLILADSCGRSPEVS